MAARSRSNMLSVAILVTAAMLGGAYTLGYSLGRPGGPLAWPAARSQQQASTPSPELPDESSGLLEQPPPGQSESDVPGLPSTTPRPQPGMPGLPSTTTQPEPGGPAPGTTRRLDTDPDQDQAYGASQLRPERGGPFGARLTTGGPYVALTFDDGPDPRYTPQTLTVLREHNVKATFCLLGENAQAHPELVRAIVAQGHTLCNHSWDHNVALSRRSPARIRADLIRTNDAIRAAVPDARIDYYRQPGGVWSAAVVDVARQLGMTPLHWTVDPKDWTRPGARAITELVTANTFPGSIVLLHDAGGDREGTVDALYRILPNLGRRFALDALPTGPPKVNTALEPQPGPAQPSAN